MTDTDHVVLLDDEGREIGTAPKSSVHGTDTALHLAFSCHVMDDEGRVLVTRRALGKTTWPGVWSNSFCGHPRPAEPVHPGGAPPRGVRARDHPHRHPARPPPLPLPRGRCQRHRRARGLPRLHRAHARRAAPQPARGRRGAVGAPRRPRVLPRRHAVGIQPLARAAGRAAPPLRRPRIRSPNAAPHDPTRPDRRRAAEPRARTGPVRHRPADGGSRGGLRRPRRCHAPRHPGRQALAPRARRLDVHRPGRRSRDARPPSTPWRRRTNCCTPPSSRTTT